MIWRLTYCNKEGVQARLDIIRGASTPVEVIEGTATPFILNYKLDKTDKSGFFMTSSADISIFETPTFNIDNLKTSSETEIKVEHYINNVLDWSGFVIPDFFSKTIGTPATVEMVASDRLGTLKGVTLPASTSQIKKRDLLKSCLDKTGLNLGTPEITASFIQGSTNIFDTYISGQRFSDDRGRSISCYDIIKSILVETNSTIRQRNGKWVLFNKIEQEAIAPSVTFNEVEVGARRTIQPVASSVGVFQEFGGGEQYPSNYDFSDGSNSWFPVNGFIININNKEVLRYVRDLAYWVPIYGDDSDINNLRINKIPFNPNNTNSAYIESSPIAVTYPDRSSVKVNANISGFSSGGYVPSASYVNYAIVATAPDSKKYSLKNGVFELFTDMPNVNRIRITTPEYGLIGSFNENIEGILSVEESTLSGYNITIRIFGSGEQYVPFINSASVKFEADKELAKGNLYKTEQGGVFTKSHDIDTTIFGDYLTNGLNGHFYPYANDDTSIIRSDFGVPSYGGWTAFNDDDELPILQHVTRQKSRLFSVAHDTLRATIDLTTFDPLAVYQSCDGEKWTIWIIIEATYNFLRSSLDVLLEQVKYGSLQKRDYIYSYFGDGESGISSVGGISGGGTGTGGGGMTPEQIELLNTIAGYWQIDENGNLKTTYNAYSDKEISAYGYGGSGGGGGGGLIETVYGYGNLGGTFSNADLNNTFNAYTINQLYLRIETLESGGGSGSVTSVGLSAPTGFTVSGSPVTSSGTLNLAFTAGYSLPTTAKQTAWDNHLSATNNPHGVTASQVGALPFRSTRWADFGYDNFTLADKDLLVNGAGLIKLDGWYDINIGAVSTYGTRLTILGMVSHDKTQFYLNGANNSIQYRKSWFNNTPWTSLRTILDTSNYASLISNVASATKLQTPRTLWGQSFDGTGNVTGALTGVTTLSASSTLSATTGIFSNLTANYLPKHTATGLANSQIFDDGTNVGIGTTSPSDKLTIRDPNISPNSIDGEVRIKFDSGNGGGGIGFRKETFNTGGLSFYTQYGFDSFFERVRISALGNVGIGTVLPSYKLDVNGTGRFTGNLTAPKVIFSAAGWAMVQVGTELQMQYNGGGKNEVLNGGSIVAVEEITAYS